MSNTVKDLSELRLSYEKGALLEQDLASSPVEQFLKWFDQALQLKLNEPYAMSLATANAQGRPHLRTVLLRGVSEQGFDFYTNYDSQKGQDLAENPFAELLFFWAEMECQVRVSGKVVKISEQESTAYYLKRPKDSQIAAHISTPQSGVIASREELEHRFNELAQKVNEEGLILQKPSFWGGYRVVPDYFEFWQGRPNRLHDRLIYRLNAGQWHIERLMP